MVRSSSEIDTSAGFLISTYPPERPRIDASSDDLAYVHITLQDDAGTVAVDDSDTVTVTVSGPGELVALSSAKPDDEEPFHTSTHTMHEGRLLAIVRPTGPGRIHVSAASARSQTSVSVIAE